MKNTMNTMKNAIEHINTRTDQAEESVKSKTDYLKIYTQRRKRKKWKGINKTHNICGVSANDQIFNQS